MLPIGPCDQVKAAPETIDDLVVLSAGPACLLRIPSGGRERLLGSGGAEVDHVSIAHRNSIETGESDGIRLRSRLHGEAVEQRH